MAMMHPVPGRKLEPVEVIGVDPAHERQPMTFAERRENLRSNSRR